jgi:hypothetical protein
MQNTNAQAKTREGISYGALIVTLAISNLAAFLYLSPYA